MDVQYQQVCKLRLAFTRRLRMQRHVMFFLLCGLWGLWPSDGRADLLRLKDGRLVDGKFLGGTEFVVWFYTAEGRKEFPVADLLSISFLPPGAPLPERTPVPTPSPTQLPRRQEYTIPAETRLSVRLTQYLDNLVSRPGDVFDATFATDVTLDGVLVIPKGTVAHGQVLKSEHDRNGSALVITLKTLVLTTRKVALATTSYAMWDQPREDVEAALRTAKTLEIQAGAFLEFKTTEVLTIPAPSIKPVTP
jgi:hypothetical protein